MREGKFGDGELMTIPGPVQTWARLLIMAALLSLWPVAVLAGDGRPWSREAEAHFSAGERHAGAGRHFLAAREFRQAIAQGFDGCEVRWKLSLALYGLGLVDEAISEIDRARQLCPEADFLHLPSGILCLARGQLEPAVHHFLAALRANPAFADAYYYLGEVYYRQGDYPRAWLCCLMARTLGHPGDGLGGKLSAVATAPAVTPWRNEPDVLHLRLIQVSSRDEAQTVLARLDDGELFENIAAERSASLKQGFGGYVGVVAPADLDPAIAAVLLDRTAFHPPLLLETAGGFQILQRIAPFDPAYWDELLALDRRQAPASSKVARQTAPVVTTANPYRIYAGSYSSEANARRRLAELEQHGFAPSIFHQETPGGRSYHVIAGRYATRQEAEAAAAKLEALGVDHYISAGK